MIKIGTKLVCKATNTLIHNGYKLALTLNTMYEVTHISDNNLSGIPNMPPRKDITIKDVNGLYTTFSDDKRHFYIWYYFYTNSEWRDKQINSILDD